MARQYTANQLSLDGRFFQIGLILIGVSLTILLFGLLGHPLIVILPILLLVFVHQVGWRNIGVPLKPLPLYLLFSTVFYVHRDLFGWGPSSVTRYEESVPFEVQILKDVVWVIFLLVTILYFRPYGSAIRKHFNRNLTFFALVLAYIAWLMFIGSLRTGALSLTQMTLLYVRNPSEYLPILLLMPWFVSSPKDLTGLGKTIFTLNIIVIGFLGYQVISGAQTGFDWGGIYRRFGSIFGSPNDLGMFSAWNLTGLVALWGNLRLSLTGRVGLLLGLSGALLMAVSVSALICAVTGVSIVFFLSRLRHSIPAIVLLLLGAGLGLYLFRDAPIVQYAQTRFVDPVTKGSLDNSQLQHLAEFTFIENEIRYWTPSEFLLGSSNMRQVVGYNPDNRAAIENYYLSLLLRGGVPACLLFLCLIGMSLYRAYRLRRIHPSFGTAGFATIASGAVAFFFIPYPDIFPTNLFYWVIVGLVWVFRTDSTAV